MATRPRPHDGQRSSEKRSRSRRKLLKALAAGAGAAAGATVVPKEWRKPIVDSLEVPLHAQASAVATMTCELTFEGVTYGPGTHDFEEFSTPPFPGDATDIDAIRAEIDPAAAGVNVHLDLVTRSATDNDASIQNADEGNQNVLTDDSGVANFASAIYQTVDSAVGDAVAGLEATFSAPGVPDCVIVLNFTD